MELERDQSRVERNANINEYQLIYNKIMNQSYTPFKIRYDIDERKQKYRRVKENPNLAKMVLLIMEPHPNCKQTLFNNYFSCEPELSQLRKKMKAQAAENLFLYIGNHMLIGHKIIGDLYEQFKDEDGFLYIHYSQMEVY